MRVPIVMVSVLVRVAEPKNPGEEQLLIIDWKVDGWRDIGSDQFVLNSEIITKHKEKGNEENIILDARKRQGGKQRLRQSLIQIFS